MALIGQVMTKNLSDTEEREARKRDGEKKRIYIY